jgi:hypothetical protein
VEGEIQLYSLLPSSSNPPFSAGSIHHIHSFSNQFSREVFRPEARREVHKYLIPSPFILQVNKETLLENITRAACVVYPMVRLFESRVFLLDILEHGIGRRSMVEQEYFEGLENNNMSKDSSARKHSSVKIDCDLMKMLDTVISIEY